MHVGWQSVEVDWIQTAGRRTAKKGDAVDDELRLLEVCDQLEASDWAVEVD